MKLCSQTGFLKKKNLSWNLLKNPSSSVCKSRLSNLMLLLVSPFLRCIWLVNSRKALYNFKTKTWVCSKQLTNRNSNLRNSSSKPSSHNTALNFWSKKLENQLRCINTWKVGSHSTKCSSSLQRKLVQSKSFWLGQTWSKKLTRLTQ